MLYKPRITGLMPQQQMCYQLLIDLTYCPVLGLFNNWNIIILSHKAITSEVFEKIRQVSLYGISNNMYLLVQSDNYGSTNTTYSTTMG